MARHLASRDPDLTSRKAHGMPRAQRCTRSCHAGQTGYRQQRSVLYASKPRSLEDEIRMMSTLVPAALPAGDCQRFPVCLASILRRGLQRS